MVDQGLVVASSTGLSTLAYLESIPGKAFTGFLIEVIKRRWLIAYALAGSLPGLVPTLIAHRAGEFCGARDRRWWADQRLHRVVAFNLSEQFPTALRGRGRSSARRLAGYSPAYWRRF